MKSFLNKHEVRGLRNNNPGNLVRTSLAWQGKIPFNQSKDQKFEQFHSIEFGIRAMLKDIIHDINNGKNTVYKLISEYAPTVENDTFAYITNVATSIGVGPYQPLKNINQEFLKELARSIFKVELGKAHSEIKDNDIYTAIEMLGNVSTQNLIVNIKKKVS
ncbi:structural protein [Flavobacterium phycosphaerae]|uniref:structural protein n=1 Tax=Flavobacterium phycosphaerae TaxID=2697515 RepID=UPI00138AAEB1|nr:structural protein [Flavobacterium phycosphaerae]